MNYETRKDIAESNYRAALKRVATTPEPHGQKFPCGSRVRIASDLGRSMNHFPSGMCATVEFVYAHAFGGEDITAYCLNIDNYGRVSWYREHQLTAIQLDAHSAIL